jgi:hypothetical protein
LASRSAWAAFSASLSSVCSVCSDITFLHEPDTHETKTQSDQR